MPFDGIVTSALTHELNNTLKGGRIEKIYQPLRDELFLQISANREKHTLFISSNSGNPRIYLTEEKSQNPVNPPPFCMLLRKYIAGGRIAEIKQHESDRVIELDIISSNELSVKEPRKLVIEIMGKHSNVILVDGSTGNIIDSIKHVSLDMSRERQILPKLPYAYPPSRDKHSFFQIDEADFDTKNIQGLSKAATVEINGATDPCHRLRQMVSSTVDGNTNPIIYYDDQNKAVEFYVLPLSEYEGAKHRKFDTVSKMLNSYYASRESSNRMNQKSADLLKTLKQNTDKLNLKKQRLSEDLEKAKKGDTYKLYGELVTANLHNIHKGQDLVILTDYYSNTDVPIALDPLLSPSENAQVYYKKYTKSKTAIEEKARQLEDTDSSIDVMESYMTYINNAETPEDIDQIREELTEQGYLRKRRNQPAQKKKRPSFLKFEVAGNFTVAVGRNNRENDELTMKKAASHDIWFHTKDIPGSHVILFTEGHKPEEKTILEAASVAAYYSKARESQNVPVDYTKIKHVKKPNQAKPGMVIFTDNKTVYVNPKKPAKGNENL